MRWLLRIAIIVSALILVVNPRMPQKIIQWWTTKPVNNVHSSASGRISNAYQLDTNQWLHFNLPHRCSSLRIIINAAITKDSAPHAADTKFPFCIEYRILDADKNILSEGLYHMHTRMPDPGQASNVTLVSAAPETMLLPGRMALWQLEGFPDNAQARIMQIRPCQLQSPITRLLSRTYVLQHDNVPLSTWNRLSATEIERRIRGNVYPAELLTADEQRGLLQYAWRPVSPEGLPGSAYKMERLLVVSDAEDLPAPAGMEAVAGAILRPGQETGMDVPALQKLSIKLLDLPLQASSVMHLRWYSEAGAQQDYTLDEENPEFELHPEHGGHLILRAESTCAFALTASAGNAESIDLTPQPVYVRAYPMAPEALAFNLLENQHYPIRIQCWKTDNTPLTSAIEYTFLTASGDSAGSGNLPLNWEPDLRSFSADLGLHNSADSAYTHNTSLQTGTIFVHKPPEASTLVLSGPASVYVALSNRPSQRPYQVRICDESVLSPAPEQPQPLWFSFIPTKADDLYRHDRTILLERLPQARHPDEDIGSGNYIWDTFLPDMPWHGDQALIPVLRERPVRLQALASHYSEINLNTDLPVNITSEQTLERVSPGLVVFLDTQPKAGEHIEVYLDGVHYASFSMASKRGRFNLKPVISGSHRLHLKTPATGKAYLSNWNRQGKLWQMRTLAKLQPTLTYTIDKKSMEEHVGIVFHSAANQTENAPQQETVLRVNITPLLHHSTPTASITIPEREYHITAQQKNIPLLHAATAVNPGRSIFIPLGSDMGTGPCKITLTHKSGPGGYVQLYRLTPGITRQETWQWLEH